jgi:predicted DsbA family dithiol-disulfide isomerase
MSERKTDNSDNGKLNIDVVSDIICPWCYVGKRHLEIAIEKMPDLNFDVRWRPFQLNPQMPEEGMERDQYMAQKFGEGGPTTTFYKQLEDIGTGIDIKFRFQSIKFAPNTFDAHRLIHWASGGTNDRNGGENVADMGTKGQSDAGRFGPQTDLVTRLFEVYFEEGGDLGDQKVLVQAATSLGMNGNLVNELLASQRDANAIKKQVAVAGKMGITGVPCFIVENKYAVMGAQKPEALVEAFEKAINEKR